MSACFVPKSNQLDKCLPALCFLDFQFSSAQLHADMSACQTDVLSSVFWVFEVAHQAVAVFFRIPMDLFTCPSPFFTQHHQRRKVNNRMVYFKLSQREVHVLSPASYIIKTPI
jgi:hypothetical protein